MWAERGRASDQQLVVKLRRETLVAEIGKTSAMMRHLALLLLLGIWVSVCMECIWSTNIIHRLVYSLLVTTWPNCVKSN